MPKVDINDFDRNNNNAGKESKRWKGLKQDTSGKYLVYVTDTSERLFEDLDSAVQYLKEAAIKGDIKKEAYYNTLFSKYIDDLLSKKITKKDGELFERAVNDAINYFSYYLYSSLLYDKIVTREDGELFDKVVSSAIKDGKGRDLLRDNIITKEDKKLFNQAVNQALEDGNSFYLLSNKYITKEDGDLFYQLVNKKLEDNEGFYLLTHKVLTKEDGELYNKAINQAINQAIKDEEWKQYLLEENIITQEDINNINNNQGEPKEALRKMNFKKEASKENAVVQRGQENLDGLKEVITRKKLVQTADGRYKVMESKRYNMKSDDSTDAKNKLRNIDIAKEQTDELPEEDAFKDVKNEIPGSTEGKKQKRDLSHKTSSIKYGPVGTCLNCHCQIFPPNTDMDHWLNRQLPADLYCPVCGYGIGTPGNFNYNNAAMNEQSVDNLVKIYAEDSLNKKSILRENGQEGHYLCVDDGTGVIILVEDEGDSFEVTMRHMDLGNAMLCSQNIYKQDIIDGTDEIDFTKDLSGFEDKFNQVHLDKEGLKHYSDTVNKELKDSLFSKDVLKVEKIVMDE